MVLKKIWFRDKQAKKDYMQMRKNAKIYTKVLHPRIWYTSDSDIFSMIWGDKQIDQTIELNLLSEADFRFDLTKNGTIVGLEIEDFSKVLRRFNCDKEPFKSEIRKMVEKERLKSKRNKK